MLILSRNLNEAIVITYDGKPLGAFIIQDISPSSVSLALSSQKPLDFLREELWDEFHTSSLAKDLKLSLLDE